MPDEPLGLDGVLAGVEFVEADWRSPILSTSTRAPAGWQQAKRDWFDGRCAYCFVVLTRATFTWDHVVPASRGGRGAMVNLVPCCQSCNTDKADRDLRDWLNCSHAHES
jgi:5-methylcytosine-specific restriction endonuclease McrA